MDFKLKNQIRNAFFPEITDLTKDYPEYKNARDWVSLPNMIFIFFHPKGTKWTVWGTLILSDILIMGFLAFSIYKQWWLSFIIFTFFAYKLLRLQPKIIKLMEVKETLYEMFIKEELRS